MSDSKTSVDFLSHYGVKGMKWGVRKKYESTGRSSSTKVSALKAKLKAQDKPLTADKKAENLAEAHDQFLKKFEPSTASSSSITTTKDDAEQKGWRPTKKQVGYALAGAAAVGGILYLNHKFKVVPGEPVHPLAFNAKVMKSQQEIWGSHLKVDADSYRQKEFTLPAGHVFKRLSDGPEDSFSFGTYTTSSDADFARYVTAFRHEKGPFAEFHEITFSAKEDIRIPDLKTRLDALKTSINAGQSEKNKWTDKDVHSLYNGLSGSSWDQDDEIVRGFFAELTKRGYSGIIDDMDAGIIGEAPLVIFNPEKFSSKTSKPLSKDQIKSIEKTVTEITNRRPIGKFNK